MRYLLLFLLFSCSEQVEDNTLVQVIAVERTAEGCTYQLEAVVPYRPPAATKIQSACGKYNVGDKIWVP